MFLDRVRAQRVMREAGVDVLIATSPENVFYMSEYASVWHRIGPGAQTYGILPCDDSVPAGLVLESAEIHIWAEQPGTIENVTVYGVGSNRTVRFRESGRTLEPDDQKIFDLTMAQEVKQDAIQALVSALIERGLTEAVCGLDESGLRIREWENIIKALPRSRFVPAAHLFLKIRMVKTEAEIERLSHAAKIANSAINLVYEYAREGMTERDLAAQFKREVVELGGHPEFWIVCGARHSAHPINRPGDYSIRSGDLIKIDVGCTYDSYWSDIGRTKCLGEPAERYTRTYEILCAGQRAAIEAARPGVLASHVYQKAVETIREAGIVGYQPPAIGHGIGLAVYDPPLMKPFGRDELFGLSDYRDATIEENMVLNLETAYYLLGEAGFIVEDTFVIGKDGAIPLTELDQSLVIDSQ